MPPPPTSSPEVLNARLFEASIGPETAHLFLDTLQILIRRKRLIAAATLGITCLATLSILSMPPSYRAAAMILPPQQQQQSSLSSLAGALGGLGSGMGSQLGLKNLGDLYVGILKSRTIADDIVASFNLQKVYHARLESDARRALGIRASFTNGRDSLITISVTDGNPWLAAALANAFVDELYKQNSRLAISDASQRRLFYEQQLGKESNALADAEIALEQMQRSTGLLIPAGQTELLIRSGAQVSSQIAGREVQLEAMRAYATDENPQILVLKREIAALKEQVSQVEADGASPSKFEISGNKLPEANLKYIRKVRDLKYHETLYELLAKQYETSRIDEARQAPVIQVIDRAIAPDKSTRPSRVLLIVGSMLAALAISCLSAIAMERLRDLLSTWKARQQAIPATRP